MADDPEDWNLPKLLLGGPVFIEYLAGPTIEDDAAADRVKNGEVLRGQPEARTAWFYLRGISSLGIEVTDQPEPGNELFISWGAVLRMWGVSRAQLEQWAREDMEQQQAEDPEVTDQA